MLAEQRFAAILDILSRNQAATVAELCRIVGASESTIRRDLAALARQGRLNKVHGGATAAEGEFVPIERDMTTKAGMNDHISKPIDPAILRETMEKLMAAYAAGERTGDGASVLEAKKNVRVGVYALDPAEYDGERVLLLLPGNCLTDEEMLAILDAYRQLGEPFDPDALNERNCVRGHTFMGTSEGDNEERRARLKGLIQRGIIRREDVPETMTAVELDENSFLGSYDGKFILTPYRRLTDDELLDVLFLSGFKNESEAIDLPAAERNARLALREKNGCPLSMELTYMNTSYDYGEANGHWRRIPFVTLMFEYVDEAGAHWNADAFINGVTSQTTGTHVYSYDAE